MLLPGLTFAMKSDEGNKAIFSHWPRFDTLFASQVLILLLHLHEATASKKSVLHGFKGLLCELIHYNR